MYSLSDYTSLYLIQYLIHPSFSSSAGRAQGWKLWGRWFKSSLKQLKFNFKLYFKCLFPKIPFSIVDNFSRKIKNINVVLPNHLVFYTSTHLKLSSLFHTTQLVDIFAYELPSSHPAALNGNPRSKYVDVSKSNTPVLVYHFHSLLSQNRIFLFSHNKLVSTRSRTTKYYDAADSITELFPAANWLEREVSEMHGVSFAGKKDLRNLMLQYGDTTAPFQKSFPTIGVREIFYNPIKDTVIQSPVSVQL